jgi:hypothetical protein
MSLQQQTDSVQYPYKGKIHKATLALRAPQQKQRSFKQFAHATTACP